VAKPICCVSSAPFGDAGELEQRGLAVETSGDPAAAIGSHALLLQLGTNLVHNAIVHNLPEQGAVWITTSVQPKRAVLTVENTGDTLTPQAVATLAEPFLRGAKRIRTAPPPELSGSPRRADG
jgi:two-component system sensor histidine kinase VanS